MSAKGRVFLLDDDQLIVSMLARALKKEGYEVHAETDSFEIVEKIRSTAPDVALLDIKLPGKSGIDILKELTNREIPTQVVMLTSDDTAETAVKAMKLGAVDYLTKPFDLDEVKIVIKGIVEKGNLMREVDYLRKVSSEILYQEIVGESAIIRELMTKARKIAAARVHTILITGESGTGKELFARYIHHVMHRKDSSGHFPFFGINCAALPEHLIESELFGHEKGAFTDAKEDKRGIFEVAYGGSILLDEIGEMKHNLQSKLLRVLEERKVRRIGGRTDIPIDVTVFATTNRDIEEEVEAGEFRMDMFYRLNAFSLRIPPLREREKDIPVLARYFLTHYSRKYNKKTFTGFSPEAEELMLPYRWPGNVRELRNVIERIVVLENAEMILPEHLPKEILHPARADNQPPGFDFTLPDSGLSLEEVEKDLILQALEKAGHNKTLAAKLLNISYDSLRYQVKKFGLE
ncbi:MAG TPA: sigma-54 dependent transcriptional regulator [Candidatus Limnocylindria bacterium]|nr:sigma-54 dependent transcriptional regulator [Candidatus Limnocylindria bacterium]